MALRSITETQLRSLLTRCDYRLDIAVIAVVVIAVYYPAVLVPQILTALSPEILAA